MYIFHVCLSTGMLRLVHAFCEAAPMLLLQLHILFKDASREQINELGVTPEPNIDEPSGKYTNTLVYYKG